MSLKEKTRSAEMQVGQCLHGGTGHHDASCIVFRGSRLELLFGFHVSELRQLPDDPQRLGVLPGPTHRDRSPRPLGQGGRPRSLTFGIIAAGATEMKHFSCFHRFFSRATWKLDPLGRIILGLALRLVPADEIILFAVDDTLGRKTGRHIWGAGMHHDPLRSTPSRPVFSFGHSWVVLSIVVQLPFVSHRRFAMPILFRLYRKKRPPGRPKGERKSTGDATPREYRTRPQLAVEMLAIVAEWLNGRRFRVVGDSEYSQYVG